MTTTRRRLAVVSTSTVALVGALALPAFASTSITAGCPLADGEHTANDPGEVPMSHDDGTKRISVDPSDGRFSGAVTVVGDGSAADCGVRAGYTDTVVVTSPTLAEGTIVDLVVTMAFEGAVAATAPTVGSSSHAQVVGAFAVTDPTDAESTDAASALVNLTGTESISSTAERGSSHVWALSADGEFQEDYGDDTDDGLRELAVAGRSATFNARVGQVLEVTSSLKLSATAEQTTTSATVERFEVDLTSADDRVVLDRGEAQPEPEPEPEPQPTALELVQQARAALAGYGLPKGIANSFDVQLRDAERALVAEQDACGALASFTAHLSALTGKKVTPAQAEELAALVDQAAEHLGC